MRSGRVLVRLATSASKSIEVTSQDFDMGIFKALGLGLTIIILKTLLPDVMSGLEGTLSAFFGVTESVLRGVESGLAAK